MPSVARGHGRISFAVSPYPHHHLSVAERRVRSLAHHLAEVVPEGPERTVSLRKLLEAKDASVRAVAIPE